MRVLNADRPTTANHDPTTISDHTLTLSLMLIINLTQTLPISMTAQIMYNQDFYNWVMEWMLFF